MKILAAPQRGGLAPHGPYIEQATPLRTLLAEMDVAAEALRGRGNPTAVTCASDLYEAYMRHMEIPTARVTKLGRIEYGTGWPSSGMKVFVDPRLPPGTYYEGLPLPEDPADAMAEARRRIAARTTPSADGAT